MKPYRYDIGNGEVRWIDLERVITIDEPGGVNRFHEGMFYGFAMTLAFQNKPMVILHPIEGRRSDPTPKAERDWDEGAIGTLWCIENDPEKYEDVTAKFKARWQDLFDAWSNK